MFVTLGMLYVHNRVKFAKFDKGNKYETGELFNSNSFKLLSDFKLETLQSQIHTSIHERNINIRNGWKDEGILGTFPKSGKVVYRIYNPSAKGGDHYYTISQYEAKSLVSN